MKRNTLIAGFIAITATAGSAAWAESHIKSNDADMAKDAAELALFAATFVEVYAPAAQAVIIPRVLCVIPVKTQAV